MNYLSIIKQYKAHVASSYKSLLPEEINSLPKGKLFVSRKYDGLFCCLVLSPKDKELVMPNGKKVKNNFSISKEIENIKYDGEIILAGELYVVNEKSKRERCSDVHLALSKKEDASLHFLAFDIVHGLNEDIESYSSKIELISKILGDSDYLHPANIEKIEAKDIPEFFDKTVVKEQSEGLIIRDNRRIFKMKRNIDLDLVVLGYTLEKDTIRSLALGLALPNKEFLHVGSVGTIGSDKKKNELFKKLSKLKCTSPYRMSASNGSLYQFVSPRLVVSIFAKDIQSDRNDSSPIERMAFKENNNDLQPLHLTPSVSILHASINEIRDDKSSEPKDCGLNQLERAGFFIKDFITDSKKSITSLPSSSIVKKQVFTKDSKGKKAVKKFIILETHKEDYNFPKYLFYYFDFSETRKTPIQRDVRPFNDLKFAKEIMKEYMDKNIKKGWEEVKISK